MSMPSNPARSLRDHLSRADCTRRFLWSADAAVCLGDLSSGSSLRGRSRELHGKSILLATRDQLAAALALIELDGIAARIVICPPGIAVNEFPALIEKAGVDAIVSDCEWPELDCLQGLPRIECGSSLEPAEPASFECATEWVLLTSGTTGAPKMIVHSLASLTAPIPAAKKQTERVVWGTFYDIRRYGGLQILLRALLGSGSMVLSSAPEAPADHLARLAEHGVTHLSGTPSHWRRILMSPSAHCIAPPYIRLSGEIADQAILNALRAFYPDAAITHAFASTEAGVAFEVADELAGFPAGFLGSHGDVEMKVSNDSLHIRSNRVASQYLDDPHRALAAGDGFVDTGDIVELRGGRYYFLGRRNGVINVGGIKVYPEEVEAVIGRHPSVQMSVVRSRKNPLTGAVVSADVLLKDSPTPQQAAAIRTEILDICRQSLAPCKVPVAIRYVASLELAAAGKLARQNA